MLDLPKLRPHRAPVLAPGKNVNPMTLSTYGPKFVLLEDSEPSSPFITLTPLTIVHWKRFNKQSTDPHLMLKLEHGDVH